MQRSSSSSYNDLLQRWFVQYNPLCLVSAALVLLVSYLLRGAGGAALDGRGDSGCPELSCRPRPGPLARP